MDVVAHVILLGTSDVVLAGEAGVVDMHIVLEGMTRCGSGYADRQGKDVTVVVRLEIS